MSGLRCRPGDMALICRLPAERENFGIVLTVERSHLLHGQVWWEFKDATRPVTGWNDITGLPSRASHSFENGCAMYVADDELMPLRPPPGAESTPTTADKPQPVEA